MKVTCRLAMPQQKLYIFFQQNRATVDFLTILSCNEQYVWVSSSICQLPCGKPQLKSTWYIKDPSSAPSSLFYDKVDLTFIFLIFFENGLRHFIFISVPDPTKCQILKEKLQQQQKHITKSSSAVLSSVDIFFQLCLNFLVTQKEKFLCFEKKTILDLNLCEYT